MFDVNQFDIDTTQVRSHPSMPGGNHISAVGEAISSPPVLGPIPPFLSFRGLPFSPFLILPFHFR